ncbi:MAG: DinB family protein [candidate division Zixibacteria bacterium]|nr:DinB family protein [candidate division Zixibacteria bacterium]
MKVATLVTDLIKYNTGYLTKHLTNMDKARLVFRPNQRHNPIIWILGHLVVSRGSLLELLGETPNLYELNCLFSSGTKPLNDQSKYPEPEKLMRYMSQFGANLVRHLNEAGDDLLNRQVWGAYDNIGKYLVNAYIHETYHVGQINYLMSLASEIVSSKTRLKLSAKKKPGTGKILLNNLKSVLTVK